MERIIKDPEKMVNMLTSVEQGNGWARGAVTATGSYDWLKNMPFEQRTTLPDGTRLLGVHASLVSDELVVMKDTTEKTATEIFPDIQADLVFAGHAHEESDVTLGSVRYITLGDVANPLTFDMRAKYAILEADASGYQVILRHVAFDYQQVVEAIKAAQPPSEPWLLKFYQRS
ncbi:MAG: putative phosphodiesterase [Candidatus Latescibacterota bacterium]